MENITTILKRSEIKMKEESELIEKSEEKEPGIFGEIYEKLFKEHWKMWIGSVLIAAMSVALFLFAQPFGASCAIMSWGQNIYGISDMLTFCAWGCIMIVIGAFGASLLSNEFSIKVAPKGELIKGGIGGLFMAFGAVLGKGCTLGSFFSGWASLSAGALIFAPGLFIGSLIASKYLIWEVDKHPKISSGKSFNLLAVKDTPNGRKIQPIIGVIVISLGLLFPLFFDAYFQTRGDYLIVVGFDVVSLFIGIVLQRSRWCIVRALREPWMSGDSKAATAIIIGILVSMFGIVSYKWINPAVEMTFVFSNFWLRGLIGGIIFGIGMTIAGGCAVGSMWRAGEGQVKLMIALAVMVFMMPIIGLYVLPAFLDLLSLSQITAPTSIFLPDIMGYGFSILLIVGLCLIWYIFVKWNEKTKKFAAY